MFKFSCFPVVCWRFSVYTCVLFSHCGVKSVFLFYTLLVCLCLLHLIYSCCLHFGLWTSLLKVKFITFSCRQIIFGNYASTELVGRPRIKISFPQKQYYECELITKLTVGSSFWHGLWAKSIMALVSRGICVVSAIKSLGSCQFVKKRK